MYCIRALRESSESLPTAGFYSTPFPRGVIEDEMRGMMKIRKSFPNFLSRMHAYLLSLRSIKYLLALCCLLAFTHTTFTLGMTVQSRSIILFFTESTVLL